MALDPNLYETLTEAVVTYLQAIITNNPTVFTGPMTVNNYMEDANPDKNYPCITLTEAGLQEELMSGDTENFYWIAPINVLIEEREAPTAGKKGTYLAWRKCLMDNLKQGLIALVSGWPNIQVDVKTRAIFDARSSMYQYVRSHFLLMFWIVEPRS